ncbi:MAG TPA: substrate-binding domain-containing protein, partial [Candidatus Ozemobacteraceae bacterium]|nr:substrate-binding domain-containing protein [Candidatus Ozemobacteraceae bacterium]
MQRIPRPLFLLLSTVVCLFVTGASFAIDAPAAPAKGGSLILATTTSTQATGLLDVLLAKCVEATGISVKAVAVGTGRAFELAKNGDADVVMVHARALEDAFVAEGYGVHAYDLMYNDFIIVGPASDSALAKTAPSAATAFGRIASGSAKFISRGDSSGTHERELEIWKDLGCAPAGSWYVEAGQGMAETLKMADEMQAYTLTDRATWLSIRSKLTLAVAYAKPEELKNAYGVIAVNNAKVASAKTDLAKVFIDWLVGPQGQEVIKNFKVDGEELFHLSV